jgi:hypothetical protein
MAEPQGRRAEPSRRLAGDMPAMKLCLDRVLPRCHERLVTLSLPARQLVEGPLFNLEEKFS